jgi:hypothetical protein
MVLSGANFIFASGSIGLKAKVTNSFQITHYKD